MGNASGKPKKGVHPEPVIPTESLEENANTSPVSALESHAQGHHPNALLGSTGLDGNTHASQGISNEKSYTAKADPGQSQNDNQAADPPQLGTNPTLIYTGAPITASNSSPTSKLTKSFEEVSMGPPPIDPADVPTHKAGTFPFHSSRSASRSEKSGRLDLNTSLEKPITKAQLISDYTGVVSTQPTEINVSMRPISSPSVSSPTPHASQTRQSSDAPDLEVPQGMDTTGKFADSASTPISRRSVNTIEVGSPPSHAPPALDYAAILSYTKQRSGTSDTLPSRAQPLSAQSSAPTVLASTSFSQLSNASMFPITRQGPDSHRHAASSPLANTLSNTLSNTLNSSSDSSEARSPSKQQQQGGSPTLDLPERFQLNLPPSRYPTSPASRAAYGDQTSGPLYSPSNSLPPVLSNYVKNPVVSNPVSIVSSGTLNKLHATAPGDPSPHTRGYASGYPNAMLSATMDSATSPQAAPSTDVLKETLRERINAETKARVALALAEDLISMTENEKDNLLRQNQELKESLEQVSLAKAKLEKKYEDDKKSMKETTEGLYAEKASFMLERESFQTAKGEWDLTYTRLKVKLERTEEELKHLYHVSREATRNQQLLQQLRQENENLQLQIKTLSSEKEALQRKNEVLTNFIRKNAQVIEQYGDPGYNNEPPSFRSHAASPPHTGGAHRMPSPLISAPLHSAFSEPSPHAIHSPPTVHAQPRHLHAQPNHPHHSQPAATSSFNNCVSSISPNHPSSHYASNLPEPRFRADSSTSEGSSFPAGARNHAAGTAGIPRHPSQSRPTNDSPRAYPQEALTTRSIPDARDPSARSARSELYRSPSRHAPTIPQGPTLHTSSRKAKREAEVEAKQRAEAIDPTTSPHGYSTPTKSGSSSSVARSAHAHSTGTPHASSNAVRQSEPSESRKQTPVDTVLHRSMTSAKSHTPFNESLPQASIPIAPMASSVNNSPAQAAPPPVAQSLERTPSKKGEGLSGAAMFDMTDGGTLGAATAPVPAATPGTHMPSAEIVAPPMVRPEPVIYPAPTLEEEADVSASAPVPLSIPVAFSDAVPLSEQEAAPVQQTIEHTEPMLAVTTAEVATDHVPVAEPNSLPSMETPLVEPAPQSAGDEAASANASLQASVPMHEVLEGIAKSPIMPMKDAQEEVSNMDLGDSVEVTTTAFPLDAAKTSAS